MLINDYIVRVRFENHVSRVKENYYSVNYMNKFFVTNACSLILTCPRNLTYVHVSKSSPRIITIWTNAIFNAKYLSIYNYKNTVPDLKKHVSGFLLAQNEYVLSQFHKKIIDLFTC